MYVFIVPKEKLSIRRRTRRTEVMPLTSLFVELQLVIHGCDLVAKKLAKDYMFRCKFVRDMQKSGRI